MKRIMLILAAVVLIPALSIDLNAQLTKTVVSLTGNVFNEITKQPETVRLLCFDENGKRVTAARSNASENGAYYMTGLRPGKTYFINLLKKGFLKEVFKIEVANTDKYLEMSRDFLIKPMVSGTQILLPVPPFELNKSKLRFGSELILEDMLSALKNNENIMFEIICFPDNNKDKAFNQTLTNERAKSLKNYFVSNGIEASRVSVSGSATTDPKNPPPIGKASKGKRYIGKSYIVIK